MRISANKISKNGRRAKLIEMLVQLPLSEQLRIHRRLGQLLKKKSAKALAVNISRPRTNKFLRSEFGKYILKEADENVSIENVRKALSKVTGSLAQEVIMEREER